MTHFGGEGDFDVLERSDTGVVGRDLDTCSNVFLMLSKFKGAGAKDTGPSPLITLLSFGHGGMEEERREEGKEGGREGRREGGREKRRIQAGLTHGTEGYVRATIRLILLHTYVHTTTYVA